MAEPHQPPYPFQAPPPQQQHQSMAPWYGMPPHAYSSQQAPALPHQHHSMPWTAATVAPAPPPPGEQVYSFVSQPYHAPPQGDFYPRPQQVHHHYPPPPQPAQPQFTFMYGQQDQVWQQANNSWGYQQWPHPAQTASLSQEEEWAAKARAWAASKAVQDESRPGPNAPHIHQDYSIQHQEQHPIGGQQHSLQPPGQESANVSSYQSNAINQGQSAQLRGQLEHRPHGQPTQDITPSITPESMHESFEQKTAQVGGQSHANDSPAIFSTSQVHDAAASYGLDTIITGPQGNDRLDSMPPALVKKLPAAPVYPQQTTHLLPQSQASPLISQPQLPYSDKPPSVGYEQQQQQQQQVVPSNYLQPPAALPPQQPPAQVPHQLQKLPLQTHYQASMPLEGVEGEFGLSPGSLQNWAPVGGPGMPFPPAMGAGTPQFDPIHTPHQLPVPWRPDGSGLQGLGFPNSAPFVVGTSPGLGPGGGPSARPLFAPDSFIERPKKAAVPSWLREELMKKKAAGLTGNASGMISSDESSRVNGGEPVTPLGQRVGISDKLRSSSPGLSEDEEEDQEAEIEAARSAAINQEIKRLLTEVLLKVTGDLFKEIAQEVLDEDDDDMPQGTPSPDERSRVVRLASPSSPNVGPPSSGRVLVSSGKNPATDDNDRDKESSDSDEAAGDVLGLGNYASDDEAPGPDVHEDNPIEKLELVTTISVDQIKHEEEVDAHKGKIAGAPLLEPVQKMKGIKEEDTTTDVKQETNAHHLKDVKQETNAHHLKDVKQETNAHHLKDDVQKHGRSSTRRDTDALLTQARTSTAKDDASRAHSLAGQRQLMFEQSSSVEKSSLKGEGRSQDASVRLVPGKGAAGYSASDASFKKLDNKDIINSQDIPIKDKKREERGEDRVKDVSAKERKREDKPAVESKSREERNEKSKAKLDTFGKERNAEERTKDSKDVKRGRGSESRIRDSSRERRKEKEKVKPRERESERDRKKQEKRERDGRTKRGDAVDKKARHHSRSSSSSAGREGSSSSGTDRSRGRQRTRRSSRHHISTSSPGRSRKRRASRSRSRSRSPHVKHTHRRNVPSPSHEKSRRSRSKSPVHRRGRG